ncbi:class I SAM-dependent methyltransferase [Geobacter benzoatilyticus]|uniref:SAM-dependent methyltransferase n=1 Tax=Geobacter benzoatilyticus TaxID=2815309 RepID=A0ABX7Q4G4_9BACT|nr:SAM-dependent methyltransferase [Geobacter benzoatilyticus]QSV46332.1 SAM-dependent methyltransferase [Geobacter benzoatilyticus]
MDQVDDGKLRGIILDRIGQRGPIPFADFMAACLYEPGLGYYTSPGRKVGAEGDFYTSINVHRVFGRLIAREICRMWEEMGCPASFDIVEAGAGHGQLATDVLDAVCELNSQLYEGVRLTLVEAEPSLAEVQGKLLERHLAKVSWSAPADLAEGKLRFSGCLYSNELIDSFPTHLVEMTPEGLREVFVAAEGDQFSEVLDSPSTPELEAYLSRLGITLNPGQRTEINLNAVRWLESAAASLERGFILTIDYGYLAPELYGPMRLNGTLLCYYRHTTEENPYIRVGLQDITTHVDFTTLALRGEELGLSKVWYGEQYRFLMAAGMMQELMALEAAAKTEKEQIAIRISLKKLILPEGGMGDTFKVLIQAKGVDHPQLLCMRDWGKLI